MLTIMLIIKNMIMVMKTIIVELSLVVVVVADIVPLYKLSIAITITLV